MVERYYYDYDETKNCWFIHDRTRSFGEYVARSYHRYDAEMIVNALISFIEGKK